MPFWKKPLALWGATKHETYSQDRASSSDARNYDGGRSGSSQSSRRETKRHYVYGCGHRDDHGCFLIRRYLP